MWSEIEPDDEQRNRWEREDGKLLQYSDLMIELHGTTVHVYRSINTDSIKSALADAPLDGYVGVASFQNIPNIDRLDEGDLWSYLTGIGQQAAGDGWDSGDWKAPDGTSA